MFEWECRTVGKEEERERERATQHILLIWQACHNNLPSSWYAYTLNLKYERTTAGTHHAIGQERPKEIDLHCWPCIYVP